MKTINHRQVGGRIVVITFLALALIVDLIIAINQSLSGNAGTVFIIIALVLAIVIWLFVFFSIDRKYREAEQLNREMNAVADIFEAMTLIDLKTGQMLLLRTNEFHDSRLEGDLTNYNGRIMEISKRIASNEAGELLSQFMDPSTYEIRLKHLNSISHDFLDNRGMWVRFQIITVDRDEEGHLWHIIWAVESINEERKQQNYLRKLAETDSLSQLRNRSSGEAGVRRRLIEGEKGVLLIMDVDDFKTVNDTCGHDVGDHVIVAVADSIRKTFRDSDIAFRLGGDEFAAFLPGVENPEQTESIVSRLMREIDRISIPELGDIHISISVGIAFYPTGEKDSFEALYQRADQEMYENKRKKKERSRIRLQG